MTAATEVAMRRRHSIALLATMLASCERIIPNAPSDASEGNAMTDGGTSDADAWIPAPDAADVPADAGITDSSMPPPPPPGRVLYSEGPVHSPIAADMVAALRAVAQRASRQDRVFAKVGDSITATDEFLACFDGSSVTLGSRSGLAGTLGYFRGGNAAGDSPFSRWSISATSGWTTADVLSGSPPAIDREISAISPRYGVVMLGTNDLRFSRSHDAIGSDLWAIIDRMLEAGVIPILSTIPANREDATANARVPLLNHTIRAIAQGRGIPLVDYHEAMRTLANQGISSDQIHPSTSPQGACRLDDAGLAYGYNLRNALTLDALDRARRAVSGETLDADPPRRVGQGTQANPFRATLPLIELGDTRRGELVVAGYCGRSGGGHELVYQIDVGSSRTLRATLVDRGPVNVEVAIFQGSLDAAACRGAGDGGASASVGPGTVYVVVDSAALTSEGEFLLVVE